MTAKEQFLNNLREKIKMYQQVYDYNKNLPDDIFNITSNGITANPQTSSEGEEEPTSNAGILRKIIGDSGSRGISKGDIVKRFPKNGKSDEDHYTIVTNSISLLKLQNEIEGIKPKNGKMRGFLWRMKE